MLRHRYHLVLALCATLLAACGTTPPPLVYRFADWDVDGSSLIERDEFQRGFAGTRLDAGWDRDGDGAVDEAEFADAAFRTWDHDADGTLDVTEWRASILRWDEDGVDFGPFDTWDVDFDGRVDRAEFDTRFYRSDLHAVWDRDLDQVVTLAELGDGFFRLWDLDASGYLDDTEWGDAELLAFRAGMRTVSPPESERTAERTARVTL